MILVTIGRAGGLIDRRRVDLTHDLPTHPHHHEGSWAVGRYLTSPWARPTTLDEAIALVGRVETAARAGAGAALAALASEVPEPITAIALRSCPPVPADARARIVDARAATIADGVLYRQAMAAAAAEIGWSVHWYDRESVTDVAAAMLAPVAIEDHLRAMGQDVGPPWRAEHRLAAAAAIAIGAGADRR